MTMNRTMAVLIMVILRFPAAQIGGASASLKEGPFRSDKTRFSRRHDIRLLDIPFARSGLFRRNLIFF
jgi:hypothetical protein